MFEGIFIAVALAFATDGTIEVLGENHKADRVQKKIERLEKAQARFIERTNNPNTVLRQADIDRKTAKFEKEAAKYNEQLNNL